MSPEININDSFNGNTNCKINVRTTPHIVPKDFGSRTIDTAKFVGRETELADMKEALAQSQTLLLLNGIGGIGKSTLASYYLDQHRDAYDYYGYIQVNDSIKASFLTTFQSSLDILQTEVDGGFREALANLKKLQGKKLLIVDDVKDANKQKEEIEEIKALQRSGFDVIFTSRTLIDTMPKIFIGNLPIEKARELFAKYYTRTIDQAKLDRVLGYIDRHTLLIEMTAKSMENQWQELTIDRVLEKFENGELTKLEMIDDEDESGQIKSFNKTLAGLFTLQNLSDRYTLILKKLSILPSIEIGYAFLSQLLDEVKQLELTFLTSRGWLISDGESYKLHQIIKEYLLANHTPTSEEIEPQVAFFYERIRRSSRSDSVTQKYHDLDFYQSLSVVFVKLDQRDKRVGEFENKLGLIYHHVGVYNVALEHYLVSLKITQEIGDRSGEGTTLNNMAGIYHARGDLSKALTYLEQSLAIRQAIGDKSGMCATMINIGHIHLAHDELDEALQSWVEAYRIATQIENAQALHALEGLAKDLGQDEGLGLWEELSKALE